MDKETNKCVICGKDSGRGKCCSSTCRTRLQRETLKRLETLTVLTVSTVETALHDVTLEQPSVLEVVEDFTTDHCIIDGIKRPLNFGQEDCTCYHCQGNRSNGSKLMLNHDPHKSCAELGERERNRVSLPGDVDYKAA